MIRLYLDEMSSPRLTAILRAHGIDVVSALELGFSQTPDHVHLAHAAGEGRCIVTKNYDDFVRLTNSQMTEELPHAEVVLVPPSLPNEDFGRLAATLTEFCRRHPDGLPPYTVLWLTPVR